MRERPVSMPRLLSLALLLLSNAAPVLLSLAHKQWDLAALVYCGGNALWIAQDVWPRVSTERREALSSVWGPCLLMAAGALSWAWVSQDPVTLNGGLGFDGLHYAALYSYFSSGSYFPIEPQFPYTQRIGLPFLAAHLALPPREAFFLMHAIFWSAAMVLFAICCRLYFDLAGTSIQFGVLWLQVLWLSVPRGAASYTFTIDSAAMFFIQAWIFLLMSGRWRWLLPVLALVGALFKETILLVVLLSLVGGVALCVIPRFRRELPSSLARLRSPTFAALALAVVAAWLAKWLALNLLPHSRAAGGSELATIWGWFLKRAQDPFELLRYVTAAFSAYGGFAVLGVVGFGALRTLQGRWRVTFAMAVCAPYFAICFFAGSDLTKFAFMAFPFALPVLMVCFEGVPPALALGALLLGLPAAHLFTPILSPVPGHEVPSQDLQGTYSWMMEYAHPAIVGSWAAWWLACIVLLRYAQRRIAGRDAQVRARA